MTTGDVAGAVGKGLFAGAVGTVAMTISSTLEMKLRGREASSVPAAAAAKVLGVEPKGDAEKVRFATVVHWAYAPAGVRREGSWRPSASGAGGRADPSRHGSGAASWSCSPRSRWPHR